MFIRLLILAAIIYLGLKYVERKKGPRRIGKKKRIPQSELTIPRRKFHQLAGKGYFDPVNERDQLTLAFKKLSKARVHKSELESYERSAAIINSIVNTRSKDAALIKSLPKWKERFERSGNTFSDGLMETVDSYFQRSDEILTMEHFATRIDELILIARHLPWLIEMGEAGKDNSVHWPSISSEKLDSLKREIDRERRLWDEIG